MYGFLLTRTSFWLLKVLLKIGDITTSKDLFICRFNKLAVLMSTLMLFKLKLKLNIARSNISQTGKTVSSRFQTPRSWLKKTAEFFNRLRGVYIAEAPF